MAVAAGFKHPSVQTMKRSGVTPLLSYPLMSPAVTLFHSSSAITHIRHLDRAKARAKKSGRRLAILVADSLSVDMDRIELSRVMLHELSAVAEIVYADNAIKGGAQLPQAIRTMTANAGIDTTIPYALMLTSDCSELLAVVSAKAVREKGAAAFNGIRPKTRKPWAKTA